MTLEEILQECANHGASDIHIKEDDLIRFRIHGVLYPAPRFPKPNRIMMFDFIYTLLSGNKERISAFKRNMECDCGYITKNGESFRANIFFFREKIAIAIRYIPNKIQNLAELNMPKSLSKILHAKEGLFLITWPTGSWKSTSLASILEWINDFRNEHIITIEDPVEYIFTNKKSLFSQREVWRDTLKFANGVRSAMKEDADIIVIGEIRDVETMETTLWLAETGHLVFSTLHTSGSLQSISRMTQFFPHEVEDHIRTRIAESLLGILSQRLVLRKDGKGRIAIRELMFVTPAIKNLILTGNLSQIPNTIETGANEGMMSMKQHAESLRDAGIIDEKSYRGYFTREQYSQTPETAEEES